MLLSLIRKLRNYILRCWAILIQKINHKCYKSTIHFSLNTQQWVTNMDILKLILILLLYGKHNLEISLTEHRLLLILSWVLENRNGVLKMDWSCFSLMDMMDKVLNILHVDLKDIYKCVIKMTLTQENMIMIALGWCMLTGKWSFLQQRLNISM
jgi:hypothetical protein